MSFFKKKKILITHNGAFHTDDLFAAATLSILNNDNVKIIRTRDSQIFEKGDYVFDVGGVYDPEKNKFDHHQRGGGGARPNGIPYSSFGLVWKKYGEQICGDKEVAVYIDKKIVQPIDAIDNGMDITLSKVNDVEHYTVNDIFMAFYPTWKEGSLDVNKIFKKEVKKITPLLKREIVIAKDGIEGKKIIIEAYNNTEDKRIIVLDKPLHRHLIQDILPRFDEPVYVIYPSSHDTSWKVEAVRKNTATMESRKLFPESWRGLMNNDPQLRDLSGVGGVTFCHQSGFFAHVKSKEGAITLAEKALLA